MLFAVPVKKSAGEFQIWNLPESALATLSTTLAIGATGSVTILLEINFRRGPWSRADHA